MAPTPRPTHPAKTILIAVDFSESTPYVVSEGLEMSRAFGARLVVFSIVQPPVVSRAEVMAQKTADFALLATEAAENQLAALLKTLLQEGIAAESRQRVGIPGPSIVELAASVAADYILLGSHGHGALYDLIVGSTASYVLSHAECPVVVVPTRATFRSRATLGTALGSPSAPGA